MSQTDGRSTELHEGNGLKQGNGRTADAASAPKSADESADEAADDTMTLGANGEPLSHLPPPPVHPELPPPPRPTSEPTISADEDTMAHPLLDPTEVRPFDHQVDDEVEIDGAPAGTDDTNAAFWGDAADSPARQSRRQKRKEWRDTERARRYAARRSVRFPIFTRSILLWMLLFAMTGAAFGGSGAFFWAHFNSEISALKEQTTGFDKRSQEAQTQIETLRTQAITDINNQIKPIAPFIAESKLIQLAPVFAPYVWFVATLDEEGRPSVGSAFGVVSDNRTTLLVTSLNTVRASSMSPSPTIELRKNNEVLKATVVSFDADRDLALLSVPRGDVPVLEWATDEQQAQALGLRVFPVSGFGGAGASLTSGVISDQSAVGFLHDARVGNQAQGGPIVTADGKVLGVASISYQPLGFDPGEMHFSIPVNQVCAALMQCGGGTRRANNTGRPPAPTTAPASPVLPSTPTTAAAPTTTR